MDPMTLSLAGGALSAGVSSILGMNEAARQKREYEKAQKYNQMMANIGTKFGSVTGGGSQASGPAMNAYSGPSAAGALAKGIGGGAEQGMNIYTGMNEQILNEKYLDYLRDKQPGNAYAGLQSPGTGGKTVGGK